MKPDVTEELEAIPDIKWAVSNLSWKPDLFTTSPTQIYCDDPGMLLVRASFFQMAIDGYLMT